MRKLKFFLSCVMLFAVGFLAYAQNINVSGKVTDAQTGESVPFASIQVKGTMTGTATDADGNYTISVPRNAILVFSSIGYLNQEAAVEGRSVVNIMLAPDTESLEELVVVAYGTVNKKDFTGSAASLDSKKLEVRPVTNATNALEGITSGVQFTSASGQPGSSGSIRIRGFGSINADSAPLYVVDGVP
ncbi:MAG: carboxypeptidase-like regulatory domain-containing protein, partial [Bacteroidales bacterium]|nr:carboxypeptidase-like regulatory domain-containing protein [Bacteroidales bacterium]